MTPEHNLLILLLSKESFNLYSNLVDLEYIQNTFRELSHLFKVLFSLHKKHPTLDISISDLEAGFWAVYPDADKTIYAHLFTQLKTINITPEIGEGILHDARQRQQMLALSEMSFKVARGQATLDEFTSLYNKLEKVDHEQDSVQCVSSNLEELLNDVYSEQGFRWRLNCLNKSLGSLRKGDFGFIFARPETGKTTFLVSEISNFLEQGSPKIVWFNNEEEGRKVFLRLYQGFFGVGLDKLLSNTKLYSDEFNKRTEGRFTLIDSAGTSCREIEKLVQRLEPDIVVYDQIDKIKGVPNDREDLRLGSIYQWARELAKGNHASIGVCQADGTAEGIRYLTMDHVSNAKTAKQAEADWILGIGKTHREEDEFVRFLNISKNKLFGDKDSNPNMKHGRFEVGIQPQVARYKDIVNYD